MADSPQRSSLIVPAIITGLALAILIGLGIWQLERREWKLGILERIDQRIHGESISLSEAKKLWARDRDVEYYRVLLVGRFHNDQERYLYTVFDGQAGWLVITPLETRNGDVVLVNRGFVPEALKDPAARPAGRIEDQVELVGLARASERRAWFTPDNAPAANRWFWRDVPGLTASLPPDLAARTVPFLVEAEAAPVPGGWPRGGVTRLAIPNRHLEYALTWFGLAVVLLAVFFAYARHRRKETVESRTDGRIADRSSSV
ncbi:MAG TPA: SURF1 family protein [Hyphomicrobiales bacterium]|jgi:surfeit locus 1 family protein